MALTSDVSNEHLASELRKLRELGEQIDSKMDMLIEAVSGHANRIASAEDRITAIERHDTANGEGR